MTRLVLLLALAACGSGSLPDTGHMADPAQPIAAPPRTGRHAAPIDLVAVTDDGTVAVSQDSMGGTRVWPTLDGSREPIVVQLGRVIDLAIGRTPTGFVIAGLDEVGGAELVALSHGGAVQTRTRLAPDPTIVRMQLRGAELLALRADQTISIISPSGAQRARLEAAAGTRIIGLYARGGRALAVLHQRDGSVSGVWIVDATWGAVTPPLQLGGAVADLRLDAGALSPDGRYLAVPTPLLTRVIALDTGLFERSPRQTPNVGDFASVAFVDDSTLVMYSDIAATWFAKDAPEGVGVKLGASPAFGGGRVISGVGDALELRSTANRAQYLGYRVGALAHARVSSSGVSVGSGEREILDLDRDLRATGTIKLPDGEGMMALLPVLVDIVWLDGDHVLATHASSTDSSLYFISVLDAHSGAEIQSFSSAVGTRLQRYQPATNLLAMTDDTTSYLVRRSPVDSRFETWYRVDDTAGDLHVLDPATSDGVVAINIRSNAHNTKTRVERIRADELVVGTPIRARETFTHAGQFLGLDPRGRVFVADGNTLVAYDGWREVLRITDALTGEPPAANAVPVASSRDDEVFGRPSRAARGATYVVASADHIALVDAERVVLFTAGGMKRWDIDAPFIRDAGWMGDELVAHFTGGLAKLDLHDGRVIAPTCGWSFALADTAPTVHPGAGESICDAP